MPTAPEGEKREPLLRLHAQLAQRRGRTTPLRAISNSPFSGFLGRAAGDRQRFSTGRFWFGRAAVLLDEIALIAFARAGSASAAPSADRHRTVVKRWVASPNCCKSPGSSRARRRFP